MILVTGAAGYIGSHFVRQLLREWPDAAVLAVDNLSTGHHESLPADDRLVFVEEDLGNYGAMLKLLKAYPIKAVVHFAACALVGESESNPDKYFANNVTNAINLCRALEEAGVRKIIHSSSCAVYGVPQVKLLNEKEALNPINAYGLSKMMVEHILATYQRCHGWSHFSLRYFNAAGAEADGSYGESHACETHLIPLVLQVAAGKREKITIFGDDFDTADGTGVRDYIHVSDLCSAHLLALRQLLDGGTGAILNLGTGVGCSVKELIAKAENITGKTIVQEIGPRRSGDPPILVADASKAFKQLNWSPQFELDQILYSAWLWETQRKY
ncbi:MAG: UDP-glucose 4-epimerase GalE [Candidatus Obscuribacterales bacterium]|nr:UDP-glucose 4-epimerase GalE [Candidatus Obscuribacterales bacterium]